jgi:hypothetical protein
MASRPKTPRNLSRVYLIVLLGACIASFGCGPELTTPGNADISGTWFATGPAAGLTSIYVTITQGSDGSISGVYTADGTPNLQFCPATPKCTIGGTAIGTNTVLQVFFELQNGGLFNGQVIDPHKMSGSMSRAGLVQPVEFSRP